MKKRNLLLFFTIHCLFLSCNTADNSQTEPITNDALQTAIATEPAEVTTNFQKAQSYYTEQNFAEAKKQYQSIMVQAKSETFKQYANQQIARCDSMLQTAPANYKAVNARVSNNELKQAMATEPTKITEALKEAESYYLQRSFAEAKKQYQAIMAQTTSDIYQRYVKQRITACDSILTIQASIVKPKAVEPLPPPTLLWWKQLDTTWQSILRAEYFVGDAKDADIKKIHDNRAIINCSHRLIKSLDAIAPLSNLLAIDFSDTKVASVAPLARLPKLSTVRLNNTAVSDLSPLAPLQSIRELHCSFSPIADLSPLSAIKELHYIDASGTKISSLAPLHDMSLLENASFSNVQSLRSLDGLSSSILKKLDVSATGITSLAPLKKCMALEVLNINGTKIASLEDLDEHQSLKKLYCKGTLIPESDIKHFKQLHTTCEVIR